MKTVIHTIENNTRVITQNELIECNKKNINSISFKVVGAGICTINSIPVDANDGFVSFNNSMLVRDASTYDIIIPTGTVVYAVITYIIRSETIEIVDSKHC